MNYRTATEEEFLRIQEFVAACPPLEGYPPHVYKILLRYGCDSCFVAQEGDRIVGFVLGLLSQRHEKTYFLWQIGIDASTQGKGVGKALLAEVEHGVRRLGCSRIEVTIDPENLPSKKLFDKCGYGNISEREGKTVEVSGSVAVKDYYSPGRHFMLYEKRL